MCRTYLAVVLLAATVAVVSCNASSSPLGGRSLSLPRFLEENNGYNGGGNSIYNSNLLFGKCVRVKVPQDNDDAVEGNSYFYNGRYHAQYKVFASYYLCNGSDADYCGDCDYSTEYVTDLETYLQSALEYIQSYCGACAAQCGGNRRLEDEQEQDENNGYNGNNNYNMQVDCSSCSNTCADVNYNGGDETAYLECQEAYQGDDGIQYYSGPQCDNGNIIIGLFYDNECTIKTKAEFGNFDYATFQAMQDACVDCSNAEMCNDLYEESLHCYDGQNINQNQEEEDDMPVCRTYKEAVARFYSKRRKHIALVPLLFVLVVLSFGFLAGSYTYYVRHRNKSSFKEPLANLDHSTDPNTSADLPPLS